MPLIICSYVMQESKKKQSFDVTSIAFVWKKQKQKTFLTQSMYRTVGYSHVKRKLKEDFASGSVTSA